MFKRRYAERFNSKMFSVKDMTTKMKSIEEKNFTGDVYFYHFKDVDKKFILENGKVIMDNDYIWLEFYDYSAKVKLTAMYDENKKMIECYFDIANEIGKENGIAYEEDLYLDVVVTAKKEIILLDEDELKDALDRADITELDYKNAYKEANNLIKRLEKQPDSLMEFTDKYLNMMTKE